MVSGVANHFRMVDHLSAHENSEKSKATKTPQPPSALLKMVQLWTIFDKFEKKAGNSVSKHFNPAHSKCNQKSKINFK